MLLRLKNRPGATMILFVLALLGFLGIMAYAIDFGRMYLFRTQVHTAADAAALAGVQARFLSSNAAVNAGADTTAVSVGMRNSVANTSPSMTTADIVPGVWTFPSGPFTPAAGGSWTASGNNAVQATARYNAPYAFGPIFGVATRMRSATSVAAVGSVGATTCVRPLALPYSDLLRALYPSASPGNPYNPNYNLTATDVSTLSAMTQTNAIPLAYALAGQSGAFGFVKQPPILTAGGVSAVPAGASGPVFAQQMGASCNSPGAPTAMIGAGDWLETNTGVSQGSAAGSNYTGFRGGIGTLCSMQIQGNGTFPCTPNQPIKVAIYSNYATIAVASNGATANCNPGCYQVKYLGVFVVTQWQSAPGSSGDQLWGYFSTLVSSGAFTPTPGPIKKIALVQ